MKFAVSNLAWRSELDAEILPEVFASGVSGLEIAPVRTFGSLEPGLDQIAAFLRVADSISFKPVAMQSFLFGKPELQLFGDADSHEGFFQETLKALRLATAVGIPVVVLGAPKNRKKNGRSVTDCDRITIGFFQRVAEAVRGQGVSLCMEPNAPEYGCDYVTTASQAARLIREADVPEIALHLDAACMAMVGDEPEREIGQNIDILKHFHASEPFLGDFSKPGGFHRSCARALAGAGYQSYISLEMLPPADPRSGIITALNFIKKTYGPIL
jgi:D-psicose/D-tagatose/L-ribulose 3-epimerase